MKSVLEAQPTRMFGLSPKNRFIRKYTMADLIAITLVIILFSHMFYSAVLRGGK